MRLRPDGAGIDTAAQRMVINPFDEVALEEALRLKERGLASEVMVVSCGTSDSRQTLRTALAMGADRAVLIETAEARQSLSIAKWLAAIVKQENISLVLCGKQATDTDAGEVGPMLAGLLGWAQATAASAVHYAGDRLLVTSEVEGGQEVISLPWPAVITADLRLNQPRYLTVQGSARAVKKDIATITPPHFPDGMHARLKTLRVTETPARKPGIMVADVAELIARLHDEGVIG